MIAACVCVFGVSFDKHAWSIILPILHFLFVIKRGLLAEDNLTRDANRGHDGQNVPNELREHFSLGLSMSTDPTLNSCNTAGVLALLVM